MFVKLTANSQRALLYAGINPVGVNLIKAGQEIYDILLIMNLLVSETPDSNINLNVEANQQWMSEYGALAIRNSLTIGNVSFEGNLAYLEQMMRIQKIIKQNIHSN